MARDRRIPKITFENARIMFKNFSGAEGQFNVKGNRNFALALDPEIATQMTEDGWNVKQLKPREEGDQPQDYIQVSIKYPENPSIKPPKVVMVTSRGRNQLDEDELMLVDYANILNVDLIIRPYQWEFNGKSGVKAMLDSIFITIEEDALELKYADVPDSAANVRQYDND